MDRREQAGSRAGDYLGLLTAWILVGGPVGTTVAAVARALNGSIPVSEATFTLLTAAAFVAALDVADRRPGPAASLGFSLTYLITQVPVQIVGFLLPGVPVVGPLAATVSLGVASVVTVRWGARGTAHRAKTTLERVVKTPRQRERRET